MKQMMDQLSTQFEMIKVMVGYKAGDEQGDAVQFILLVLAGIALVGIVVAAVTVYLQTKTSELG